MAGAVQAQEADDLTTSQDAGEAKSVERGEGDGRERLQLSLQGSLVD